MTIAQDYLHAIVHRNRVPMGPAGFEIDWADMPRRGKVFRGVEALRLDDVVAETSDSRTGFGLAELAEMLRRTYADSDRRLALHANSTVDTLPRFKGAQAARGTASGGSRYPVSIHWVVGPGEDVAPGVYYYSTFHHTLQRMQHGDVTPEVAAALDAREPAGSYLVLGIKYWQNAFKYNSFCFHAVSMDIGTITESWRQWAGQRGHTLRPALWFDESALADLLDVDTAAEGLFAVVPLPASAGRRDARPPRALRLRTGRSDDERSRRVIEFEAVTAMQKATMDGCTQRPAPGALRAAAPLPVPDGPLVPLPPAGTTAIDVDRALRVRHSSFGRFSASRPTTPQELGDLLAAAQHACGFACDADEGPLELVSLYVFVNHVAGVEPGAYRYDPARHALAQVAAGPFGAFLQAHYYLDNYNLEQAGVVIVPAVRGAAVLDAVGDRGYRLVNAVIGAVSQALYLAAADADLGCGAALGFDNVAYAEQLHIDDTDTVPLIIVLAGHERPARGDYHYRIH